MPQRGEQVEVSDNGVEWQLANFLQYKPSEYTIYPFDTDIGPFKYCRKVNNQTSNNSPMSTLKQTIKNIMRVEPNKTFVKVGFMDNNEEITETGKEALQMILWDEYQTKLKELADKLNVEEK